SSGRTRARRRMAPNTACPVPSGWNTTSTTSCRETATSTTGQGCPRPWCCVASTCSAGVSTKAPLDRLVHGGQCQGLHLVGDLLGDLPSGLGPGHPALGSFGHDAERQIVRVRGLLGAGIKAHHAVEVPLLFGGEPFHALA